MKKPSHSRTFTLISRILNVRRWFDWERIRSFTLYLGNGLKRMMQVKSIQNQGKASFDEAVKKLEISDTALLEKQKSLYRLSLLMTLAAGLIFIYAGYQLIWGSFKAFILSLIVTLIALALAFRYHFWYYQIKEHKLGCTIQEWLQKGLLRKKQ